MNAVYTLLIVLPFVLAVLLANAAERNKSQSLRILNYLYLLFLNGLLALIGLGALGFGLMQQQGRLKQLAGGAMLDGVDWSAVAAVLLVGSTLAMLVLLPPVRRLVARLIPIDPASIVHATALSLTVTMLAGNLFQMAISGVLLTPAGIEQAKQLGGSTYLDLLIFPLLTFSVTALIGVGLYLRRNWGEVMQRLGLTTPTVGQVGIAVGAAFVLLLLAVGADRLWAVVDPVSREKVGGLSQALLGNMTGLPGAFAIGITAAIGEETFFRGAYQPRMGIVMAALLFASFHVQYFISIATLQIFVFGLLVGVLRQRTNLTVCILVHFLYNFASVLLPGT
jgi:uncharacterized protein